MLAKNTLLLSEIYVNPIELCRSYFRFGGTHFLSGETHHLIVKSVLKRVCDKVHC